MLKRLVPAVILVALIPVLFSAAQPATPAAGAGAEEITIIRDPFGVPNIFARTEEGAVFGMGYSQAEDRLEEREQDDKHTAEDREQHDERRGPGGRMEERHANTVVRNALMAYKLANDARREFFRDHRSSSPAHASAGPGVVAR